MHRKKRTVLKPIYYLILTFSVCILLDFFLFVRDANIKNQHTASELVEIIGNVIDYAEETNTKILAQSSLSGGCQAQLPAIRTLVTTTPFIRSISTGAGDVITCHSLVGELDIKDPQQHYQGEKLALITGNLIQSRHPIILLKKTRDDRFVVTAIDGVYIQTIMQQLSKSGSVIQFSVGNVYLSAQGALAWNSSASKTVAFQRVMSDKYPFAMSVSLRHASLISAYLLTQKFHLVLIVLLFAALSLAVIRRARKPYTLDDDMRIALKGNEFIPYGQRIVNLQENTVAGIEVLVRWQHPSQGLIRPDIFIPQAEKSGLIIPMTRSLFTQVADCINSLEHSFAPGFYVSFNITALHCADLALYDDCIDFLEKTKGKNVSLVLELTEREIVPQNEVTYTLFKMLSEAGIQLAIDDFGTGHSSYAYLNNHHISILKIDRSFVDKINANAVSGVLIDSIIDLGHKLSLKMIAEGIEEKAQALYLKNKQVIFAQGYLYGKPQPLDELLSSIVK